MGQFFQNFPKIEPKLAQIWENLGNFRRICSKFGSKLGQVVYEWSLLLETLLFVWVYFKISRQHKIKLESPSGVIWQLSHTCFTNRGPFCFNLSQRLTSLSALVIIMKMQQVCKCFGSLLVHTVEWNQHVLIHNLSYYVLILQINM